jgi:hypothetical protein
MMLLWFTGMERWLVLWLMYKANLFVNALPFKGRAREGMGLFE